MRVLRCVGLLLALGASSAWTFDTQRYLAAKTIRASKIAKDGAAYVVGLPQYNPQTGQRMEDDNFRLSLVELDERIAYFEGQVTELRGLKADLEATP